MLAAGGLRRATLPAMGGGFGMFNYGGCFAQGGDTGVGGAQGPAGQDAKQSPPQQCFGAQTVSRESICCGGGTGANPSYWQQLTQGGMFTNVDTSACKFSDDSTLRQIQNSET